MRSTINVLTLLAGTALATGALAQSSAAPAPAATAGQPAASNPATATQVAPLSAAEFANQAAIGNMFEIQSSQLATSRSQNEQVKQFGQRMIKDHTQAADRLKSAGRDLPSKLDERHAKMISELQGAKGPMFDRRFVQDQVTAHQEAVQLYDRYAQSGDDKALKQLAQELLPNLREHLQIAQNLSSSLPPDRVGAAQGQNQQATRTSDQQSEASRIVVQQSAPTVRVDQASPVVSVQQKQPEVTVNQPQPQITVRQPQPTVTIDIPQPEIIVRMPQPDVNVAMAQPQVEVNQPQPQVQVAAPPGQPQVQVEQNKPTVQVSGAAGQPSVNVQQSDARPQVNYERSEPRVVVNQPQGQPKVRYEPMQSSQNARTDQQQQAGQRTQQAANAVQQRNAAPGAATTMNDDDSAALRERLNGGETDTTASVSTGAARTRAISISALEDMNVYNARGEELGEVDRVIVDGQNRKYLVVGNGGFLGIGRDRVAFPLDRFWARADRIVIRGVTEQDIENMDNYRSQFDTMRRLRGSDRADLRIWQ